MDMILGINYSGLHDSSISLLDSHGEIIFAASEERYSRFKKESRFPSGCLAKIDLEKITRIAVPGLLQVEPSLEADPFFADVLLPGHNVLELYPQTWRDKVESLGKPIEYFDHHEAHAAAGVYLSGLPRALVVTADYGAFGCPWNMGFYAADGMKLTALHRASNQCYHALCSLYSDVTAILGFRPNLHEGKITGLAAFGAVSEECERELWALHQEIRNASQPLYEWIGWMNGGFSASLEVNRPLVAQYRKRLEKFSDQTISHAAQRISERNILKLISKILEKNAFDNVVLSGGFFANVKVNLEIKRLGFKKIFICPPMSDDGLSLGAAALALSSGSKKLKAKPVFNLFLGSTPASDPASELSTLGVHYTKPKDISEVLAQLLAQGKTVARVSDRMEFGPRALGHRSLLYQATDPGAMDWLNKKLKRNEFMPFAPLMRVERAKEFFDAEELSGSEHTAEFMTICLHCNERFKELCPAVVHVDDTARPQFVRKEVQPDLYATLLAYENSTGLPAIINTSFNVHDEPIVGSARDAVLAFFQSDLDFLIVDDCLVASAENPLWRMAITLSTSRATRETKLLHQEVVSLLHERLATVTSNYEWNRAQRQNWEKEYLKLKEWVGEVEKAKIYFQEQAIVLKSEFERVTKLNQHSQSRVQEKQRQVDELVARIQVLKQQSSAHRK